MAIATPPDLLLIEYVRTASADALGQLIEQKIDFVYATARRHVRDASTAEDVTQAVFMILARKAPSIPPASLTGWLFNTTRFCAADARRSEIRRARFERRAARSELHMPLDSLAQDDSRQLANALLDQAMASLCSADRDAVLMRYLEGMELSAVSAILGISQDAARKRIARAVDRLRKYFLARGINATSATMAGILTLAPQKAPFHLASASLSAALGHGAPVAAVASITRGAVHMMAWAKAKIVALIIALTVVGAGAALVAVDAVPSKPPASPQASNLPPLPAPSTQPATSPSTSFKVDLGKGYSIEFVGISSTISDSQKSWAPDGNPIALPPMPPSGFTSAIPIPDAVQYTTLWKFSSPGPLNDRPDLFLSPGAAFVIGTSLPAGDMRTFTIFLPKDRKITKFAVGLATADWNTIARTDNPALGSDDQAALGRGQIPSFRILPAADSHDGLHLQVLSPIPTDTISQPQLQILAHTTHGDVVGRWLNAIIDNDTHFLTRDALIPQATLADTTAIEVQTRSYQWVQFDNVSLDPHQFTHPQIILNPKSDPK